MNIDRKQILILGGGFAGVHTARCLEKLLRAEEASITLINRENYWVYRRSADGARRCRCLDREPAAKRSTCWWTAQGSSFAAPVSGWSRSMPQRCVGAGESSISGWTPTRERSLTPS